MRDTKQITLEHGGRHHLVTLKPMPKGTIVQVHAADGPGSAATSVRPAERPEAAARWLLDHHKMFRQE